MYSLPACTACSAESGTILLLCALIIGFVVLPIVVIMPLSFHADTCFTFSDDMLRLDPDAFSLQRYGELLRDPNRPESLGSSWLVAAKNSLVIAVSATALATFVGTLAALGLTRAQRRGPVVATSFGDFFYSVSKKQ